MYMVDLCSGLGGASEPFIDRKWRVIRIDNDSEFKDVPNTIIANVNNIKEIEIYPPLFQKPDFVWASPPCNKFSIARVYDNWDKKTKRPTNIDVVAAIRIVMWCMDVIDYLKPKYWVIENPRGMLRNILNAPGKVLPGVTTYYACWGAPYLKPTDLWGNLPNIDWPAKPKNGYEKAGRGSQKGIQKGIVRTGSTNDKFCNAHPNVKNRAALRSKVPYKLGEAICKAIEKEQMGVED